MDVISFRIFTFGIDSNWLLVKAIDELIFVIITLVEIGMEPECRLCHHP